VWGSGNDAKGKVPAVVLPDVTLPTHLVDKFRQESSLWDTCRDVVPITLPQTASSTSTRVVDIRDDVHNHPAYSYAAIREQ
jgi:hypothetical protein